MYFLMNQNEKIIMFNSFIEIGDAQQEWLEWLGLEWLGLECVVPGKYSTMRSVFMLINEITN